MTDLSKKLSLLGLAIWFLSALFYPYGLFLSVFISTISDFLMADLHLDASQFALIGAGYYFTYALMQIPVGILADRFGPRFFLTIATFLTALGGLWFAFADTFVTALLSRCLIGFGASFSYVCLLILTLNWFPRKDFGFMVGFSNFLGAAGPILAGGPLAFLLIFFHNDWRFVLIMIAGFGFLLATVIGLFVRNTPARKKGEIIHLDTSRESLSSRLVPLLKNSQLWFMSIYLGFIYVGLLLLGAYWGTAYLQARGVPRTVGASISSMLWIGFACGAPLLGKLSEKFKRRNPFLLGSALLGIITTLVIIYWPTTPTVLYGFLFLCVGLASSGMSVAYAVIAEQVQPKFHAAALGISNTVGILFIAILPYAVSFIIEKSVSKQEGGFVIYSVEAFQEGFVLMPIFYTIALLVVLFFVKETYSRQQFEVIKIEK